MKITWSQIKEAISGTGQDFTKGSLNRAIFLLSLPMVLEMGMESIFAITDIYFLSKLGSGAVAVVGITESMLTIIYAIGMGLGMSVTAVVARRIGEGKPEEASRTAVQAIYIAIIVGMAISFAGIFYPKELLLLMGADSQVTEENWTYPAVLISSNVVIMLLFIINAIFRSAGDPSIAMRVLWTSNIINIALDPVLIFGIGPFPELGIMGAAIASTTGRSIGVIYQFYLLNSGNSRIKIERKHMKFDPKLVIHLIKISLGGIGQLIVATSSWIGLMRIMSAFGNDVLAGYTISIRIIIFSLLPSWGISNAAATLVGQNLGADNPERAEQAVYRTSILNTVILVGFGIVFISFPKFFIQLFINDPSVIAAGVNALQVISVGFLFYGAGMVIPQAFNGSGDTITPTILNLICFWMIELPLAYVMANKTELQANGIYWSIVVAESMLAILGFIIFAQGKWKTKKV